MTRVLSPQLSAAATCEGVWFLRTRRGALRHRLNPRQAGSAKLVAAAAAVADSQLSHFLAGCRRPINDRTVIPILSQQFDLRQKYPRVAESVTNGTGRPVSCEVSPFWPVRLSEVRRRL